MVIVGVGVSEMVVGVGVSEMVVGVNGSKVALSVGVTVSVSSLTFGVHTQRGLLYLVCKSVCLSVTTFPVITCNAT